MNIVTRYVAKEVVVAMLMVLACLCGLDIIFSFIKEARDIGQGGYNALQAMLFILLNLPSHLYLVLPMSALLGVLIGLGNLSAQHELIVLQTSGCSMWRICRGVLVVAAFMMPFSFMLGGYLSPLMSYSATVNKKMLEKQGHALLMGSESIWLKDGRDFIHIGKTLLGGRLNNITRYEMDGQVLKGVLIAQYGEFDRGGWMLYNVTQTSIGADHIDQQHFDSMQSNNIIAPHLIDVVISNPQQLTFSNLSTYIEYRKENALNSNQYELSYWRSLFQPISTLLLMLFAVPFVFGMLRSSTTSVRLLAGVIIGVLLYTIDQFFGPFSLVYRIDPLIGAAAPSLIFSGLVVGVFWYFR
jgi:lipopolysaccharide export system permease protein